MKKFGIILLIAGFLSSAFLAITQDQGLQWLPLISGPISDEMKWLPFGACMIMAIFGLTMIKRAEQSEAKSSILLQANKHILNDSIANILREITKINNSRKAIPCWEMRLEIDKRFRDDLNKFAEARKSMIHLYGIQAYADIMSNFAAGERYLNRVWSASADGYVDEVLTYIEKAKDQFSVAKELLDSHNKA